MALELFLPNNHSTWKIEYRPVAPDEAARLTAVFLRQYGDLADQVLSLEQVSEAEINSNNFKVSAVKDGRPVTYLLRRYPEKRSLEAVTEAHALLDYLRGQGLNVPEILTADDGQLMVAEGAERFSAFRFLQADHYRGTLEELASAARAFGKLDTLLVDAPNAERLRTLTAFPEPLLKLREYSEPIWQDLFAAASDHLAGQRDDEFDRKLLSFRDVISEAVHRTPSGVLDVPWQLVHFDLHPHNLLTDGVSLVAILDFDSVRYVERMRAVAFALHRLVRQHIVFTRPQDIADAVRTARTAFLSAYLEQGSLTSVELASVASFVRSEALARLSYMLKEYYFNGNGAWKGDLEKQVATLAEAALFEDSSRV